VSSEFIQIGDVRIKRANIASFGVAESTRRGEVQAPKYLKYLVNIFFQENIKYKYLYLTTHQRDNYTFTEDEINLSAVLTDLEKGKGS
jgi:hypothetical protein